MLRRDESPPRDRSPRRALTPFQATLRVQRDVSSPPQVPCSAGARAWGLGPAQPNVPPPEREADEPTGPTLLESVEQVEEKLKDIRQSVKNLVFHLRELDRMIHMINANVTDAVPDVD